MKRRTFLKNAGLTGAAVLGASAVRPTTRRSSASGAASFGAKPNILVIIVDQLRIPRWFPNQAQLDQQLPNLAALRRRSVSFKGHYTAATACTPSRAALLTGLYTHQTAMLTTIVVGDDPNRAPGTPTEPPLHPGFPTWGTALRGLGYQSWWFGKWHLTNGDQCDLSLYGFNGGTCPSPNGFPGQGQYQDPCIVNQFSEWIATSDAAAGPWCTTVSLNNPHDIAWYFRYTECPNVNQTSPPRIITKLPGNFETPDSLRLNKPGLQTQLWQGTAEALGLLPYSGPGFEEDWVELLNLYLLFQTYVDVQIGRVMSALAASPYAQNTVVVFTADHGEYAGSHGLRGKGGGVYDEGINIPLFVSDPTGRYSVRTDIERSQLTSSVDLVPLFLTIASDGGTEWKTQYPYLSNRLNLVSLLQNPSAAGRPYILSTTDELAPGEILTTPYATYSPTHAIAYRTTTAKLGLYSYWNTSGGQFQILPAGEQREVYDYTQSGNPRQGSTPGTWEVDNVAQTNTRLSQQLYAALIGTAIPNELRAPLPADLLEVQQQAIAAYLRYAANPGLVQLPRCASAGEPLPYPTCPPSS